MNMAPRTLCPRTGKIVYDSAGAAHQARLRIKKSRLRRTTFCYRCSFCGLWHLTSSSPSKRPRLES